MIRVDHAGEYGAQRIYDGQLFILHNHHTGPIIREMKEQEVQHLNNLEKVIPTHRVRPTVLLPLWDLAGFSMGAMSALLGPKYAMACTVAVEEVITEHYNDQLRVINQILQKMDSQKKGADETIDMRKLNANKDYSTDSEDDSVQIDPSITRQQLIELKEMIKQHRDDEENHKDIGIKNDALQAPLYQSFADIIKVGCKVAIAVSSRI